MERQQQRQQFSECIEQSMEVMCDQPTVWMSVSTAMNQVDHDAEELEALRRENLSLKSISDRLVKSLRIARLDAARQNQSRRDLEQRVEAAESMVGELLLRMELTAMTGVGAAR